jgi:hypothetical protein
MQSLTELAAEKILKTIEKAPSGIKDIISDKIKEDIEQNCIKTYDFYMPFLVSDIVDDMLCCENQVGRCRLNYYKKFEHIDKNIIKTAIDTAELMIRKIQNTIESLNLRQINGNFDVYTYNNNDDDDNNSEASFNSDFYY